GAEAGQRALDGEGGEHRADRGINRVATCAQDLGPRLGGKWVTRCDDPAHGAVPQPGRNSGTSRLPRSPGFSVRGGRPRPVSLVRRMVGSATRRCGAPRPSKRVATTVTQTWSPRSSSTLAPKMMLASG